MKMVKELNTCFVLPAKLFASASLAIATSASSMLRTMTWLGEPTVLSSSITTAHPPNNLFLKNNKVAYLLTSEW